MRRRIWMAVALGGAVCPLLLAHGERRQAGPLPPRSANISPKAQKWTDAQGVVWETSFAQAKARATREGKPIFLLHLFGRLDDAMC